MKWRVVLAALAASALCAGSAFAQAPRDLLENWGIEDMRAALVSQGGVVNESGVGEDDLLYLHAQTDDGVLFSVYGAQCSGEGVAKRCTGAEFVAVFDLETDEAVAAAIRRIDFAAVSYFNGGEHTLRVTRYLIFDHGIARANLEANARVYMNLNERIRNEAVSPPTTTGKT